MVRIPYEDNKFVGSSVILLVVVGCIIPVSVVSIFGFRPQPAYNPPPYTPEQQGEVTLLPPPHYSTIGNGTVFDSLVNETVDPVTFSAEAPIIEGDTITVATAYPSGNISLNESQAINKATSFISSFEYMQGLALDPTAFLSNRIPCWIVNSEVEGGSVTVWVNAISGVVCFYMVNVDLQMVEDTDLRLYFSGPTDISLETAENNSVDFLQQMNYTLVNGSRYNNPYFRPLPEGINNEGFVNGEYIFQIYGMDDGIFERNNRVLLQVEASTGAIVYFSYLWTVIPEYPEIETFEPETIQNSAISYLHSIGIRTATLEYPNLILDAEWFPDIGYSGSIYWQVGLEGITIQELIISPITGQVYGHTGTVTATFPTATGTGAPTASYDTISLGLLVIPLSSLSLGLAGYMIVKNIQSRKMTNKEW